MKIFLKYKLQFINQVQLQFVNEKKNPTIQKGKISNFIGSI